MKNNLVRFSNKMRNLTLMMLAVSLAVLFVMCEAYPGGREGGEGHHGGHGHHHGSGESTGTTGATTPTTTTAAKIVKR